MKIFESAVDWVKRILQVMVLVPVTLCVAQEAPRLDWAKNFGTSLSLYNSGDGIAVDGSGNSYIIGNFSGTNDFDPGPAVFNMSVTGSENGIFISKFNAAGDLVWAKSIKNVANTVDAITVDASGNITVAGYFDKGDVMDFDPGPGTFGLSAVGYDMFILRLTTDGDFVWVKHIRGSTTAAHVFPEDIVLDGAGNIYTAGYFQTTVDFDPGAGTFNLTAGEFRDIFISKLDTDGNFVWAKAILGAGTCGGCDDKARSIALDASGNVYTSGFLRGTSDFDPGTSTFNLTPATGGGFFVSKLDNNGDFVWAKTFGGAASGVADVGDMAVDASGNVYTTGGVYGTSDFDPGPATVNLSSAGTSDIFISKLDANGDFVWARLFGAVGNDLATTLDIDGTGNVYTGGVFNGTVDFDPGAATVNLTGSNDYFLQKLDTNGNFVWVYNMNIGYESSIKVQLPNVYATGTLVTATSDFDPGPCTLNLTSSNFGVFVKRLRLGTPIVAPTITSFTPASGPIGTSVTITGTNFSSTPAENVVRFFNNRTATVTASTATSITTTVPASSTTGVVSVTTNCLLATSASNFTVTVPTLPTITSFAPGSGNIGTTVVITGTNFSTTPANNTVAFNGTPAVVTASTATSITTTVPVGTTTGKITVTVAGNTATSATDFAIVAPANFVTRWNLATTGSGATQLTFGTATAGTVNYTWQEISPGTASGSGSWNGATLTITGLPAGATIRLQILPANFQRIIINTGTDRNRLTVVEQWGTTAWTSMQRAFLNCSNLQVTAPDVPNLSGVTSMSEMFRGCGVLNSPANIGSWNTSTVTDMSALFSLAGAFNRDISSWNTAAVTNMSNLFADAAAFNQNIGSWNTAAVTNMAGMFAGAITFNQNIGSWNTAAVTTMSSMFFSAYNFNQNISGWNTAAVTNMASMFGYAYNFNQNIGPWNTSAVTTMSRMFEDAFDFNQNIGVWNTSSVTNMRGMFIDAYAFNQNIGTWNTSAVTDMSRMFDFATTFNQNIGTWNTAAVTDMSGMFADASAFNQNLGTWTLNANVNLASMFNNTAMNCGNYSATLIGWSANPTTPNGRSLGATGRQYGTNAVTARTTLTTTKGWTITGDTPSGAVCNVVALPTISSFTPGSGPVGTTVTITGINFSATPASNTVTFNGVTAVVTASTATSITVTVPAGATTGKISITVAGNTATSTTDFTVTPPAGGVTITTEALAVGAGGTVTTNLVSLITTTNNNLDVASITVTVPPPSGAVASVVNGVLTVDYTNVSFSGKETITISACDTDGNCATQTFEIEVLGDIVVYNGISLNNDELNDKFIIDNIDLLPETQNNKVTIYNRWGDAVWEGTNYDNQTVVFIGKNTNGNELPSGTYFYNIQFNGNRKTETGYLVLRR